MKTMNKLLWVVITLVLAGQLGIAQEEEHWEPLFNGENFDGFTKLNGDAKYHVEDGQMVGISEMGTPNTFMTTDKNYSDFILEFEVRVDARLNSGVQIRSNSIPSYRDGRVHGYQVEIDPSSRAYSGGIYDEARRGWIYPLSRNPRGRKAFNNGAWNAYRVEAIGPSIRVWINGVNTSNLIDDMTAEGFIGFQVHGIGDNKEKDGAEVRWKNIRITTENLDRHRWEMDPDVVEINLIPNTLSNQETRRGWRMLWDGKTSDGWVGAKIDGFPQKGWTMKDGELIVESSDGAESRNGGDIITKDKFSNFELSFEFNLSEGANSGVKYFVDPNLNKGTGSAIGLEYQVLDDKNHLDAKKGVSGNRTVASLYDLIPAHNLSVPSRSKPFNGIGNWNRGRILSKGNHVEHWLNGFKVLEYERRTPAFRALVAYSKYKDWANFGEWEEGHILLQDHGDKVAFRNIKVREF